MMRALVVCEWQCTVPPTSEEENELAGTLQSGMPLFPIGRGQTLAAAPTTAACGTAYSVRLQAQLRSSLCSGLSGLSLRSVRAAHPLSAVSEQLLAQCLRASLRELHSSLQVQCEARQALLEAAKTSLAVFAAFATEAAAQQLVILERLKHAAIAAGASAHSGELQQQLRSHAAECRRLPPALRLWAEAAFDDEGIDAAGPAPPMKRDVLDSLSDVDALAARDAAAAEELAAALSSSAEA